MRENVYSGQRTDPKKTAKHRHRSNGRKTHMKSFSRSEIRKILGEACTEEIETSLVTLHREVLDSIKDERDALKVQAEKLQSDVTRLSGIEQKYNELKAGDYESKYAKEHEAFEAFKGKIDADALAGKKQEAFMAVLEKAKISAKRRAGICKLESVNLDGYSLDENGHFTNEQDIIKHVDTEYSEYKEEENDRGADVDNPPHIDKSAFATMSLTQKMAYANQHPTAPEVIEWLRK